MNKIPRIWLVLAGIVLLGVFVWYFKVIIAYVLVAAVVALIAKPVVQFLDSIKIGRFHIPKSISALITLAVFWGVIISFFRYIIPLIVGQAKELSTIDPDLLMQYLQEPINNLSSYLSAFNIEVQNGSLSKYLINQLFGILNFTDVSQLFASLAETVSSLFVAFFAITFISFFFLRDDKMFMRMILVLVPDNYEVDVRHAVLSGQRLLMRYFWGICVDIVIVFILIAIGMSIVGLSFNHALLLALVTSLLNVVPYIGPLLSWVFGFSFVLVTSIHAGFYETTLPTLIWMFVVYVTVNVLDATLIQPFVFSNSVKAHPLEIFLVILMAGMLAGIPGMILAIPSYTMLRVMAKEFLSNIKVVKKLTRDI